MTDDAEFHIKVAEAMVIKSKTAIDTAEIERRKLALAQKVDKDLIEFLFTKGDWELDFSCKQKVKKFWTISHDKFYGGVGMGNTLDHTYTFSDLHGRGVNCKFEISNRSVGVFIEAEVVIKEDML